jgi:NADPH:quinone reductase-like Zn-dependent oxidoreductase
VRTARAAVYEAPNTPFVLKEFPLRPAKRGEVLVRVTMSTICRSDIHSYEGRRPNPCPGILGHEIIGVIEEIGEGIEKDMRGDPLKVGDRITWSEYFFDGQCYYREVLDMPQKCHGLRKYGHDLAEEDPHFLGGFAEYCYILPGTWILLPRPLSLSVFEPNFLSVAPAPRAQYDGFFLAAVLFSDSATRTSRRLRSMATAPGSNNCMAAMNGFSSRLPATGRPPSMIFRVT